MTNNKPFRLLACGVLAAAVSGQSFAAEYSPSVTIRTRATPAGQDAATGDNRVVPGVEVQFWEDEGLFNNLLDTVETDSNGVATTTFQSANDPDIFVVVVLVFNSIDGKKVRVRDEGSAADLDATSGTWNAIAAGATDLGTFNLPDNKANIGTEARDCLKDMDAAYGAYAMPRDMIAYAGDASQASGAGDWIELEEEEYHDPGVHTGGAFSVIHHEAGHWIHLNEYNPGGTGQQHWFTKETNVEDALIEGWAEYVAEYTADGDHMNQFQTQYGLEPAYWWRGTHGPADPSNNTGADNAGDIVEGALWHAWSNIGDMAGTFKVLLDDQPGNIHEWLDGYGSDKNWEIDNVFEEFQANGIVYTRANIKRFDNADPPNDAPEAQGDAQILGDNDVQFLRGTVTVTEIYPSSDSDLNLSHNTLTLYPKKLRIGYKVAADGLNEATEVGSWSWLEKKNWGEIVPAGVFTDTRADPYDIDTTAIGKDGAYDLIVQAMNEHDYWDNFDPNFAGDSDEAFNSDEKWLKSLQTWFNQDHEPDNNHEGKVIIDNTQPEVDENARKPPPN